MTISIARALAHATSLLIKAGVNEVNSEKTARAIVTSDVWGNPSHGLMRLPFYLQRLSQGGVNPKAELKVISEFGSTISLDGQDGLGHWQLLDGAQIGVTKAKQWNLTCFNC